MVLSGDWDCCPLVQVLYVALKKKCVMNLKLMYFDTYYNAVFCVRETRTVTCHCVHIFQAISVGIIKPGESFTYTEEVRYTACTA